MNQVTGFNVGSQQWGIKWEPGRSAWIHDMKSTAHLEPQQDYHKGKILCVRGHVCVCILSVLRPRVKIMVILRGFLTREKCKKEAQKCHQKNT